jgi:ketosteroid isomerase-like protein
MVKSWILPLFCGLLPASAQAGACAPASAPAPVTAVQAMYAAAMAGDKAAVSAQFAPGFYAFDTGKRYSGEELAGVVDLLKAMHVTMTWTVSEPQQTVMCDVALVTWTNRGTSTDASGTKQRIWLESAVERWRDGAWKLIFFQSSPVPEGK